MVIALKQKKLYLLGYKKKHNFLMKS